MVVLEWWIKEEVEKYKGKKVRYNKTLWTVVEVFWNKREEEFVYWIENNKKELNKVFEKNIELVLD